MSPKEYRSLARYIASIAKDFGLRDWDLSLDSDPCDDDAIASVNTAYGRKAAVINVAADFEHYTPEAQRMAVIHELIHIHQAQIIDLIERTLPNAIGAAAFLMFNAAWRQAMEHSTDGLATAIADRYPIWVP